jgi:pheromone shutdown protein TraB
VRTYDDGGGIGIGIGGGGSASRTVHILGTAHISSSSAELAGRMVRDLRPDVVFVELDAKRVARAMPGGVGGGGGAAAAPGGAGAAGNSNDPPPAATTTKTSVIAASPPPRDGASSSATTTNPFDVQSRLVDAGSKVVGESVRGMYTKLESEGFKAGDEFATSVREGLAIGSTIVLGDRDVEVTLRRLTRALTKTDIRKLLSPDSEVEKSMEGLLPEGMKKSLTRQSSSSSSGGGGGGGGNDMGDGGGSASKMTGMGMEVSIDKSDFNDFIETMKARENVRKIMSALRSTAPEIYEAMVAERDEYMGRGLDELGANLPGRSSGRTVAVVGMAHVDGIERYLASRGWTEMSYPCPR